MKNQNKIKRKLTLELCGLTIIISILTLIIIPVISGIVRKLKILFN